MIFFKDPFKDYYIPIRGIANWFDEIVIIKKREDICNLLKELIIESLLPDIALPTVNGKSNMSIFMRILQFLVLKLY